MTKLNPITDRNSYLGNRSENLNQDRSLYRARKTSARDVTGVTVPQVDRPSLDMLKVYRAEQVKALEITSLPIRYSENGKPKNSRTNPELVKVIEQVQQLKTAGKFRSLANNLAGKYQVAGWIDDIETAIMETWLRLTIQGEKNRTTWSCARSDGRKFILREVFGAKQVNNEDSFLNLVDFPSDHNPSETAPEITKADLLPACKDKIDKQILDLTLKGYKLREIAHGTTPSTPGDYIPGLNLSVAQVGKRLQAIKGRIQKLL